MSVEELGQRVAKQNRKLEREDDRAKKEAEAEMERQRSANKALRNELDNQSRLHNECTRKLEAELEHQRAWNNETVRRLEAELGQQRTLNNETVRKLEAELTEARRYCERLRVALKQNGSKCYICFNPIEDPAMCTYFPQCRHAGACSKCVTGQTQRCPYCSTVSQHFDIFLVGPED